MHTTTLGDVAPGRKFWFPSHPDIPLLKGAHDRYRRADGKPMGLGNTWLQGSPGVTVCVARKPLEKQPQKEEVSNEK